MKIVSLINPAREELLLAIAGAVKPKGCIGTFYKNTGQRHTVDQTEEEYPGSPVVVVHNKEYRTYGGYEAATVYDLYIDGGRIMCTLNGEAGEDWDEPIENIQIEGLLNIVSWLSEYGFVVEETDNPFRCVQCGSPDVQIRAWIHPNESDRVSGFCSDGEDEDNWCNSCESHTELKTEDGLLDEIEEWWDNTGFKEKERITGYRRPDFSPGDGYREFVDACNTYWEELPVEEKIEKWSAFNNE
jgi:hypothetical protein